MKTPELVMADWLGDAATLRSRGHLRDADLLERCAGEMSDAVKPFLQWVSEPAVQPTPTERRLQIYGNVLPADAPEGLQIVVEGVCSRCGESFVGVHMCACGPTVLAGWWPEKDS